MRERSGKSKIRSILFWVIAKGEVKSALGAIYGKLGIHPKTGLAESSLKQNPLGA